MKEQLATLDRLQKHDSSLAALQKAYAALDSGQTEKQLLEQVRSEYTGAEAELHAAAISIKDLELEQQTVEAKRKECETRLYGGKVRVPKELQALQEEVEMLGRLRGRLDEKILETMDRRDQATKREAELRAALASAEEAYRVKETACKQDTTRLAIKYKAISAERETTAASVDAALLKKYEALRAARGGIAVATLEDNNACSGCKMAVSSNLVRRITSGDTLEYCDNCQRILLAPPATEA